MKLKFFKWFYFVLLNAFGQNDIYCLGVESIADVELQHEQFSAELDQLNQQAVFLEAVDFVVVFEPMLTQFLLSQDQLPRRGPLNHCEFESLYYI